MSEHPSKIPAIAYGKPKTKHYIEYFLFRSFSFFLELLPIKLAFAFAHGLANAAMLIVKRKRKETEKLISEHLNYSPEEAKKITKKSSYYLAENWVYLCRHQKKVGPIPEIDTLTLNVLKNAKKSGRGIVFATGHFSWWELVPKILFRHNLPFAITVAVHSNPLFDRYINKKRTCDGFHAILHNRLGIRHTFNYLKRGGHLVILADVDVREKGIPIPFLGEQASTPRWPAELAIRADALLCCTRLKIEDGKASIIVTEPIDPRDYDSQTAVIEILRKMNDHFSDFIHDTPEQWFWLQRRWKTKYDDEV